MFLLNAIRVGFLGLGLVAVSALPTAMAGPDDGFPLFGGDNGFSFLGGENDFPDTRNGMALLGGDNDFDAIPNNKLKTCGLIDFDHWDIRSGIVPETWFLAVSGRVASTSLRVQLLPVVYTKQPQYWEVQVVACTSPIALPVEADFNLVLEVTSFMGTKGIEIVGATKSVPWDKDDADK